MSAKELDRVGVMARVGSGELKLVQAAGLLGVSYRQAKRLRKVFRERGALGLKHGNAAAAVAQRSGGEGARRDVAAGAGALRRRGRGTFRTQLGGGASGAGAWAYRACGDIATLDAGRGLVEPGAAEEALPQAAGGQGAFRGVVATGRKSSSVVGRAESEGLPDEPGG